jgi:hypothetical protein
MKEGAAMTENPDANERILYRIEVEGKLDERWSDWFSGLTVAVEDGTGDLPVTTLLGSIDQAGLRGILNKIWDLNLALISVVPVEADGSLEEVSDEG